MGRYCHARVPMNRVTLLIYCLMAILVVPAIALAQVQPAQVEGGQSDASPMSTITGMLGKPAPAFLATTLDGKQVSLADYKGKALIVNFWATWCGACKLEMPWLAQLREQYASQGLEILGIVTDGATDDKVRQIVNKNGVRYTILRCNHKTAVAYGSLPYLPESFFIGRDGDLKFAIAAADSKGELEGHVRSLLGLGAK